MTSVSNCLTGVMQSPLRLGDCVMYIILCLPKVWVTAMVQNEPFQQLISCQIAAASQLLASPSLGENAGVKSLGGLEPLAIRHGPCFNSASTTKLDGRLYSPGHGKQVPS
jgi:hypothetical protein